MNALRNFLHFTRESIRVWTHGSKSYYAWVSFCIALIAVGVFAYVRQFHHGLIVTAMRDPVSWGFYIGNFTFLVGVAAAAVILVIPAYLYQWKPIKEIVILGELLAIAALIMCMLFVTVDIGRPDRFWHVIPLLGYLHLPNSLLAWDVCVLSTYLLINLVVATYMLVSLFRGRQPKHKIFIPLVYLSIPVAIGIHTVTAFIYNGEPGRPFWNASILAPRFLASAFSSGPAIVIILLQILRKTNHLKIRKEAIWKIAELMAYAMFINLFFLGAEVFKEWYSNTEYLRHMRYLYFGLHGHAELVPWAWTSVVFSVAAFLLFLIPKTRKNIVTLNLGCVLIWVGVYLEKGMGLVIPGFTPSTLGEIYPYTPTLNEFLVAAGVFGIGALAYTLMVRVAIEITSGRLLSPSCPILDYQAEHASPASPAAPGQATA